MPHRRNGQRQNKGMHQSPSSSESTLYSPPPDANSRDLHSPYKLHINNVGPQGFFVAPMPSISVGILVPAISSLHTVLTYFIFDWDVRADPHPNSLPKAARDEPAFHSFFTPQPVTIWLETPLGHSACVIKPSEHNGTPVPINVGRVLAGISRHLYKRISRGHNLLTPAVRKAAESRPYDPEPNYTDRAPRNVDLYPVYPARHGSAPLFFRGIELQHCGGGAVRLVARFGPQGLKII